MKDKNSAKTNKINVNETLLTVNKGISNSKAVLPDSKTRHKPVLNIRILQRNLNIKPKKSFHNKNSTTLPVSLFKLYNCKFNLLQFLFCKHEDQSGLNYTIFSFL